MILWDDAFKDLKFLALRLYLAFGRLSGIFLSTLLLNKKNYLVARS